MKIIATISLHTKKKKNKKKYYFIFKNDWNKNKIWNIPIPNLFLMLFVPIFGARSKQQLLDMSLWETRETADCLCLNVSKTTQTVFDAKCKSNSLVFHTITQKKVLLIWM